RQSRSGSAPSPRAPQPSSPGRSRRRAPTRSVFSTRNVTRASPPPPRKLVSRRLGQSWTGWTRSCSTWWRRLSSAGRDRGLLRRHPDRASEALAPVEVRRRIALTLLGRLDLLGFSIAGRVV